MRLLKVGSDLWLETEREGNYAADAGIRQSGAIPGGQALTKEELATRINEFLLVGKFMNGLTEGEREQLLDYWSRNTGYKCRALQNDFCTIWEECEISVRHLSQVLPSKSAARWCDTALLVPHNTCFYIATVGGAKLAVRDEGERVFVGCAEFPRPHLLDAVKSLWDGLGGAVWVPCRPDNYLLEPLRQGVRAVSVGGSAVTAPVFAWEEVQRLYDWITTQSWCDRSVPE